MKFLRKVAWNMPAVILAVWIAGDSPPRHYLAVLFALVFENALGYFEATFEPGGYRKLLQGD